MIIPKVMNALLSYIQPKKRPPSPTLGPLLGTPISSHTYYQLYKNTTKTLFKSNFKKEKTKNYYNY